MPIGEGEDLQDVKRCFNALHRIIASSDELVVVRHPIDRQSIDHLTSKFNCLMKVIDHPETRTASAARNVALENCRYRKIIFQDIDDVPHLNRRQIIKENLHRPGTIVTTGYESYFDDVRTGQRQPKPFGPLFYFRSNIFLPTSAVYFREGHTVKFDNLKIGEDTVFFSKLIYNGYTVVHRRVCTIDYHIKSLKIFQKRGLQGVFNEIQYRWLLTKYTRTIFQKILVLLGCTFFIIIKLLPENLFSRLYAKGHRNE